MRYSPAMGAHDRRTAWENRCKKMARVESTQEFQRTGGNEYEAQILVPGEDGFEWQYVRNGNSVRFATADAAIAAATKAVGAHNAKRARVLHFTIDIASEYGWKTNDEPVWRWVREAISDEKETP